jgi:small conductance mechanosensitive channel
MSIFSQFTYQNILNSLAVWMPKLMLAVVIFVIFVFIYFITKRPLYAILRKAKFDDVLSNMLIGNIYKLTLLLIGAVTAVSQIGVNVSAALTGIGVVGVAIGFAAQDSFSNIIAGFLIFWDRPFKVGEWISPGDLYGRVVDITMRSTRIRTKENTYIIIPNQKIINEILINHSKDGMMRVNLPIGIAFKESVPEARKVLLNTVSSFNYVLKDPAPDVVLAKVNDSSIDLLVRVWIEDAKDEKDVFFGGLEACKLALDEAGIQIPFPHRQVFIEKIDKSLLDKFN